MKDFYGKKNWKIEKKKSDFLKNFWNFFENFFEIYFAPKFLGGFVNSFLKIFGRKGWDEGEQGVGERSEPSAGGLAVGAEGSVNSEFI